MKQKLDLLLAICKAKCDRCHKEDWLYIPLSDYYGLLCENCIGELGLFIDMVETRKNLGGLMPNLSS